MILTYYYQPMYCTTLRSYTIVYDLRVVQYIG